MMKRALLFLFVALLASAGPVLPGSTVDGKTLGEWSGEWWKWVFSFPAGQGVLAGSMTPPGFSEGRVFLLAASGGSPVSFQTTISSGQYLLVPLITTAYFMDFSAGDTLADGQQYIASARTQMTGMYAQLDGVTISDLLSHWEASPLFSITIPPNGIYNAGTYPTLAGGYWLMLEPLAVGRHTLKFGGQAPDLEFAADSTVTVDVVPEPATVSLTAGAVFALLAGGALRRRRDRLPQ